MIVQLQRACGLRSHIFNRWFKQVSASHHPLAHSIGGQRRISVLTSGIEMDGDRITSCKNIRIAGLHIIIHVNGPIRIHINLADQQLGHRPEPDTNHRQICLYFAFICLNKNMLLVTIKMLGNCVGFQLNPTCCQGLTDFMTMWQVNIMTK